MQNSSSTQILPFRAILDFVTWTQILIGNLCPSLSTTQTYIHATKLCSRRILRKTVQNRKWKHYTIVTINVI